MAFSTSAWRRNRDPGYLGVAHSLRRRVGPRRRGRGGQDKKVGGDATYVHLDVTRDDEWRRAVDLAESTYGKLNVLINNAGIAHGDPILN